MRNKNISLAYCKENANIAKNIIKNLAVTDYKIEEYLGEDFHQEDATGHLLVEFDQAVLLIISDNFLKSTDCMYGALKMLQQLSSRRLVLPVIADGRTWDEQSQSFQYHPTSFEKVSNVIQYMNFWQEQYLEVRRKKRHIQPEEEKDFNKILKKTRSISSEVGEFLRHLRNLNFIPYQNLKNKKFEAFFKFMNDPKRLSDYAPQLVEKIEVQEEAVLETVNQQNTAANSPQNMIATFQNAGNHQSEAFISEEEAIEEAMEEIHQFKVQPEEQFADFLDKEETVTTPISNQNIQNRVKEKQTKDLSAWEQIEQLASSSAENIDKEETIEEEEISTQTAAEDVILLENIIKDVPSPSDKDTPSAKVDSLVEDMSAEESLQALENIFNEETNSPHTSSSSDTEIVLDNVLESVSKNTEKENIEKPKEDNFIESLLDWNDKDDTAALVISKDETNELDAPHEIVKEESKALEMEAEISEEIEIIENNTVETVSEEEIDITAIINDSMAVPDLSSPLLNAIEIEETSAEVVEAIHNGVNDVKINHTPVAEEMTNAVDLTNIINHAVAVPDLSSPFLNKIEIVEPVEETIAETITTMNDAPILTAEEIEREDFSDIIDDAVAVPDLTNDLINSNILETPHTTEITATKTVENNILETTTEQTMLETTNVTIPPSELDDLFQQGLAAQENGDYKLAKKHLKVVAKANPNYPAIYEKLGYLSLYHFVDAKKASKYFKKALKANPTNVEVQYQYANLLYEYAEKPYKAATHFKNTLQLEPQHPFANYDLALIYYQLGEKFKANRAYLKAIEVNPQLKTEQNDLAFAYIPSKEEEIEATKFETLQKDIQNLEQLLVTKQSEEAIRTPKPGNDKTVFITGATSGIGRATAEVFAKNGYRLIITGRRKERLKVIKGFFKKNYDIDIQTLPFDVRDLNAVKEALEGLTDEWRQIDILINNAGLAKGISPIHEGDIEEWDTMIDTNIKGLLYMTRAIAPHMVRRNEGHIINVCSTSGKEVYAGGNVYCATKFAVDALTKAMRIDLFKHKIRVSQVSPAHVEETEFSAVRFNGDTKKANKVYEDFRPLAARDVAEAIYFMASRPAHVNILDVTLQGRQQASANHLDRSGR